jgi:hypothetical protein
MTKDEEKFLKDMPDNSKYFWAGAGASIFLFLVLKIALEIFIHSIN